MSTLKEKVEEKRKELGLKKRGRKKKLTKHEENQLILNELTRKEQDPVEEVEVADEKRKGIFYRKIERTVECNWSENHTQVQQMIETDYDYK